MRRWTLACLMVLAAAVATAGPDSRLGSVDFPNSGSPEAQEAFIRGLAALHSFWYEEAAEAFQHAQQIDREFAMAYWGEAMSYNHPLWSEQDMASARQVLRRFGETRQQRLDKAPTERERMYMEALETLYGRGDKMERDVAYSKAMARLAEAWPDDTEAQAFYALSLLGTVRPGDQGFSRQMKAGAIALKIFQEHPNHPGAAHYVIHSFDDPEHAPLALPAANRYAEIAPEAHHALHMPTHIFVQHGMWHRVAQSNLRAYNASAKWVEAKHLSVEKRDYHSLRWRAYANLQRGAYGDVLDAIEIVEAAAKETQSTRLARTRDEMYARYMIESGRCEERPLPEATKDDSRYNATASTLLALGLGAAERGDVATTEEAARRMAKLRAMEEEEENPYQAHNLAIMEHELLATARIKQGRTEEALEHASRAASIEESQDPPSGPAYPMKPSHELYGELLLEAGRYDEAIDQLETSLQRTPNRTASLLAMARSAAKAGRGELTAECYGKLQGFLSEADPDVPFLTEVREFKPTPSTQVAGK